MRAPPLAAALLLWLLPLAARALPPETWLLLVGNNEGNRDEPQLLYAERDAREVAEVFRQHGPVPSQRIQLLLGEQAETVRRTLVDLNAAIRARAQEGRPTALLVFYSGHADAAALHLGGSELQFDELKGLVAGSPAGVRLLLVDACRSGTVTRVKGVQPAPSFELGLQDEVAASGLAILTSSAAGETSQESDRLRGSFFTHHLLNALRGAADQDGDGRITLGEAYAYAYAQTLRASGQTTTLQHPTYSWDIKGRGELVLTHPAELRGRVGRLRLAEPATYLVLEGGASGAVAAEVTPPAPRRELSLPAGDYFVQQRLSDEYREFHVLLEPGAQLDLAATPFRPVHYDRLVRQRGGDKLYVQGVSLLVGLRGEVIAGEGPAPQLLLGYTLDLPSLALALRLRASTASESGPSGLLPRRHDELGAGLLLQRFVDFSELSLGFGLFGEVSYQRQGFDGPRTAPARNGAGAAFGGLLTAERHLASGLSAHLEAGPMTQIFSQATMTNGVESGSQLATPLTFWLAGGLVWRL